MVIIEANTKSSCDILIPKDGEGISVEGEPVWSLDVTGNRATFVQLPADNEDKIVYATNGNGNDVVKTSYRIGKKLVAHTTEWTLTDVDVETEELKTKLGYLTDSMSAIAARFIDKYYRNKRLGIK